MDLRKLKTGKGGVFVEWVTREGTQGANAHTHQLAAKDLAHRVTSARAEVPTVELLPTRDGQQLMLRRQFPAHRALVLEARRLLAAFQQLVLQRRVA